MQKNRLIKFAFGLILFGFGFWLIANHFWFPFDRKKLLLNAMPAPPDYIPVKSLTGDIFLRHQDNGKEYLISVSKQEVSVIKNEGGFVDLGIVYTGEAIANTDDPQVKIKLTDSNLVVTDDLIKFTAPENENWIIKR